MKTIIGLELIHSETFVYFSEQYEKWKELKQVEEQ